MVMVMRLGLVVIAIGVALQWGAFTAPAASRTWGTQPPSGGRTASRGAGAALGGCAADETGGGRARAPATAAARRSARAPGSGGGGAWHQDTAGYAMTKDRKSTRLNSSHANISYAVFCLKKKNL